MHKRGYLLLLVLLLLVSSTYFILAEFPGSVTVDTPVDGQNISGSLGLQATIATLDDNTNVTNITFEFDNGNGTWQTIGINDTENLTVYAFNWDTTAAGGDGTNFTINVTALFTNQTNFTSSGLEITTNSSIIPNVTVDNTAPTVTANEPADNAILNTTEITFNATVIDLIFTTIANCNLTLDPTNSSDGAVINSTTNVANGTDVLFINTITTGGHIWNIACTDSVDTNNTGYTANSTFNGGTTSASISIDLLDSQRTSKTTFAATEKIIIACTRSDEDGFNETIVSVSIPGLVGPSVLEKATESVAVNDSRALEVTFEDTSELGDYLALCEVTDVVGNTNSTNISFTIQKKLSKSTSAFANKKFAAPIAKIKVNSGSTSDVGRLPAEGISRLLQKNAAVKFTVDGEEHSITVKELNNDAVTLTVRSTPFDITIKKGESQFLDVNEDGKSDIQVMFHKAFGSHADITIAMSSGEETGKSIKEKIKDGATKPAQSTNAGSVGSIFVIFLILAVILIIGYVLLKGKKK